MIETEDDERKWILIVSNRKRMVAGDVLAQSCVNFLKQVNNDISCINNRKTFQLVRYVNWELLLVPLKSHFFNAFLSLVVWLLLKKYTFWLIGH